MIYLRNIAELALNNNHPLRANLFLILLPNRLFSWKPHFFLSHLPPYRIKEKNEISDLIGPILYVKIFDQLDLLDRLFYPIHLSFCISPFQSVSGIFQPILDMFFCISFVCI